MPSVWPARVPTGRGFDSRRERRSHICTEKTKSLYISSENHAPLKMIFFPSCGTLKFYHKHPFCPLFWPTVPVFSQFNINFLLIFLFLSHLYSFPSFRSLSSLSPKRHWQISPPPQIGLRLIFPIDTPHGKSKSVPS